MQQVSFSEATTLCSKTQQPIPLSINGNEIVYLMNEKLYQQYLEALEFEAVMQGFDEIDRGEYVDAQTFFKDIKNKYGI